MFVTVFLYAAGVMYNGNGCSPAYAPYTYVMPPMGVPLVRPQSPFPMPYSIPRPPFTPLGVNYAVQRSMNSNGTDLPYNGSVVDNSLNFRIHGFSSTALI